MSISKGLETLINLNKKFTDKSMNESETRFQIIDKIIKDVFHWPESLIRLETKTNEGFTDYILEDSRKPFLVIEAKREKIEFNFTQYSEISNKKIKVKLLLKDKNTKETIEQVKNYCNDIGCSNACITNGHEWAFFRTYIDGKSWQDGDAFIIYDLKNFIDNYSSIQSTFSFNDITKKHSLTKLFAGIQYSSNERYDPKSKISAYKEKISSNYMKSFLYPYFDKYFGEIRNIDLELLKECYVSERGYKISLDEMTNIIEDSLSPYMADELQDIKIKKHNDDIFSKQIENNIIREKKAKVLVLFGGKGSGKTTFLINLFYNNTNKTLDTYSKIAYINLLNTSNDKDSIKKSILHQLLKSIDTDKLLDKSIDELIKLFHERYTIDLRQSLSGLDENSSEFIQQRNKLIKEYKEDIFYCLQSLSNYWRNHKKAIIIVIDNTDQFDQDLQDYTFSLGKELSDKLQCLTIISLREERYVSSNIRGYLDAFEQNGFHISAPVPQKVFLKRLEFIKQKIHLKNNDSKKVTDANTLFEVLENNINDENSQFNKFMIAATHGNIRDGMELFKNFIYSSYTQVKEMINNPTWVIQIHQILKPIMISEYIFYDENVSKTIPNLYRLRSDTNSSHFTAYRILEKLSTRSEDFISIHELENFFTNYFDMKEDFYHNLKLLLHYKMIESENGLDTLTEDLQKVKVTAYGYYMQRNIFKDFSYLELTATDTTILDKRTFNEIVEYSNKEYQIISESRKINKEHQELRNTFRAERLKHRVSKVESFIEYLLSQEKLEKKFFHLDSIDLITKSIRESLNHQIPQIHTSAKKILKTQATKNKHGLEVLD